MNAYIVVGPTNDQPSRLSRFDNAVDVSVIAGISPGRPAAEIGVRPEVGRHRAVLVDHLERPLGIVDRRPDLALVPHDADVTEQALDVALVERRDDGRIEPRERGPGSSRACGGSSAS